MYNVKNILVTGGYGFIGSAYIRHMMRTYEYNIINLDKMTYAARVENIGDYNYDHRYTFIQGDICDEALVESICKDHSIDVIINFAAESHVDRSIENSDSFIYTNISGTHTLLKMFHKFPIKKFLQVSTDEVYGSLEEGDPAFTEDTPLAPNSPYAASKASADMLCRSFYETYNYPIAISRCSNNYGPFQYPEKLIPLMIEKGREGDKLPIYGDGRNIRDWIHVDDHVEALDAILWSEDFGGQIYNIGGEEEKRNIDIVKSVLYHLGKGYTQIEYVEDRKGHDWRYAMNIDKIYNELNWWPKRCFEQGIKELVTGIPSILLKKYRGEE